MDEIVIIRPPGPPGWPCPNCHGMGSMCDGSASIGPDKCTFTPATRCWICNGKGVVRVTPVDDDPKGDK